jgi:hypothetical protein
MPDKPSQLDIKSMNRQDLVEPTVLSASTDMDISDSEEGGILSSKSFQPSEIQSTTAQSDSFSSMLTTSDVIPMDAQPTENNETLNEETKSKMLQVALGPFKSKEDLAEAYSKHHNTVDVSQKVWSEALKRVSDLEAELAKARGVLAESAVTLAIRKIPFELAKKHLALVKKIGRPGITLEYLLKVSGSYPPIDYNALSSPASLSSRPLSAQVLNAVTSLTTNSAHQPLPNFKQSAPSINSPISVPVAPNEPNAPIITNAITSNSPAVSSPRSLAMEAADQRRKASLSTDRPIPLSPSVVGDLSTKRKLDGKENEALRSAKVPKYTNLAVMTGDKEDKMSFSFTSDGPVEISFAPVGSKSKIVPSNPVPDKQQNQQEQISKNSASPVVSNNSAMAFANATVSTSNPNKDTLALPPKPDLGVPSKPASIASAKAAAPKVPPSSTYAAPSPSTMGSPKAAHPLPSKPGFVPEASTLRPKPSSAPSDPYNTSKSVSSSASSLPSTTEVQKNDDGHLDSSSSKPAASFQSAKASKENEKANPPSSSSAPPPTLPKVPGLPASSLAPPKLPSMVGGVLKASTLQPSQQASTAIQSLTSSGLASGQTAEITTTTVTTKRPTSNATAGMSGKDEKELGEISELDKLRLLARKSTKQTLTANSTEVSKVSASTSASASSSTPKEQGTMLASMSSSAKPSVVETLAAKKLALEVKEKEIATSQAAVAQKKALLINNVELAVSASVSAEPLQDATEVKKPVKSNVELKTSEKGISCAFVEIEEMRKH